MQRQNSYEPREQGILYLVPTPIGNLEDMTFRAIRTMKEADIIAAEDTRNTSKLCNHFEITTPLLSYHEHNAYEVGEALVERLRRGETIALVSDAGMPCISDPGVHLVELAIKEDIAVVPLPGANAALTALIASGIVPQPFTFYGFLPRKTKERDEVLASLSKKEETWILYEAPHRLKKTLTALQTACGGERKIVLARELTKRFEEFLRGTVEEAVVWASTERVRGEFCLIIEGTDEVVEEEVPSWAHLTVIEHVDAVLEEKNVRIKDATKEVAQLRGLKAGDVYKTYHQR